MSKIYRIPSKLYHCLFQYGIDNGFDGDKLISVYSILKANSEDNGKYYAFTSKNNKKVSGYSILRAKTNLTLHSLKKYVPILIELELCFFDSNNDFVLIGNDKIKKRLKSNKIVPILIGKNIIHTAYNVYYVRLHSNERKQKKAIEKKHNQRELLKLKDNPRTLKELKAIKRLQRKGDKGGFFIDKCVLSIKGFSYLKFTEENKQKGNYWKKKLIDKKLVSTKRRFEVIKKMSYKEFLNAKSNCDFKRNLKYINGCMVLELVSELKVLSV